MRDPDLTICEIEERTTRAICEPGGRLMDDENDLENMMSNIVDIMYGLLGICFKR